MSSNPTFRNVLSCVPLALALLCACGDDDTPDDGNAGTSGHTASNAGASGRAVAGSSGRESSSAGAPATQGCPTEIPVVGEPCQTRERELCQWRRRGPCPPDADQLRVCHDGKWTAAAPAIRCPDLDAGADAGSD